MRMKVLISIGDKELIVDSAAAGGFIHSLRFAKFVKRDPEGKCFVPDGNSRITIENISDDFICGRPHDGLPEFVFGKNQQQ